MAGADNRLQANTWWFHVFRSMIDAGDVAKIGPHAFTVYAVIKAHSDLHTGLAFPGVPEISRLSGVSVAQVKRGLRVLEEFGYLKIGRVGRNNRYTLRERVQITGRDGQLEATASWDYRPSATKGAMDELKALLVSSELVGAGIIQIQNLAVQVNVGGHNFMSLPEINISSEIEKMQTLPAKTREKLRRNGKLY